jgi:ABC-2 type transport system ATP-binding protein
MQKGTTVETVIKIDRLTKRYGTQTALENVSWEVPRGTIFALLGENGAGKTTALRLLLGLIEPTSGSVEVLGLDPVKCGQQLRRRVGYLSEQPGLYDWMTVAEIGRFTGAFYGDCPFFNNYRRLADELELPWSKQIKALSKGVRAKVALSLALAQDPELLVLDEPTSGLDLLVRREILDRIVDLAAAGKTVLLSSHQIAEVERVADTAAILSHGRLVALASLDELKQQTLEITLTLASDAPTPPPISGETLRARRHARQWQMLVRNCPANEIERLRSDASITSVDVHTPRLEEIVAGYLQPNGKHSAEAEQL